MKNYVNKQIFSPISQWTPLVVISLIALILRLYRLDYQSVWYDESFSILVSRLPLEALLEKLITDYVQPPLHYLLLHFLPFSELNHSTGRMFSGLCGWLTVPVFFFTGKVFFDKATGSIAAILLAVSQLAIMYSQEIRPYAQQMLFICATLLFFGLAICTFKQKYWWAFVVFGVLSIYTHYYSIFVVAPLYFWALFCEKHLPFRWLASGVIISVLLYFPWLFSGIIEVAQTSEKVSRDQPSYFAVSWKTFIHVLNHFNNGSYKTVLNNGHTLTYVIGMILFTIPALIAIFRKWLSVGMADTHSDKFIYLLTFICFLPIIVPIIMGLLWKVQFDVRYTLAGLPAYYLLVARGMSLIDTKIWRQLFVSIAVLYSLFELRANYFAPYKENWRDSLALVAKEYRAEDCMVFSPFNKAPLAWQVYGYDQQQPKVNVIVLKELNSKVPACDQVWLYLYSRVDFSEKKKFAIQAISDSHIEVKRHHFHWIDVRLYKRRDLL